MKYPIGIQQFEKLREEGWIYIDKTAHIHRIASRGTYFFLSRPRRFGKSLLMSTVEAYFKGKRHLFEGLAIEKLEKDWIEYPVLHFDLNAKKFDNVKDLSEILNAQLYEYEQIYDSVAIDKSIEGRFKHLIRTAKEKTGRNVVVLIDEYDKPMLQAIGNEELQIQFRNMLKAFYGTLKSADGYLRFVLLTGVTKFSKISVFSDLNNLNDISMDAEYSDICGITEEELHEVFDEEVAMLAENNNQTKEEAYQELKRRYDGYHFSEDSKGMYNPFSILNTLLKKVYRNYWFSTGTPTYLVELLKRFDFDLQDLSGYETTADALDSIQIRVDNPIPVLYQSGYLTISSYDDDLGLYTLDFPNEEVEESFIRFLIPMYSPISETESPAFVGKFVREVRAGKVDDFMKRLQSLMADTPYEIIKDLENHYQNVMFILTKLMGFYVQAEYRTSYGRIDLLIATDKYVYVIEIKIDSTPEEALRQINDKEYSLPFTAGAREVIKIGANVSREKRNLESWIVERIEN